MSNTDEKMDVCDELEAKWNTVHGGAYAVMRRAKREIERLRAALAQPAASGEPVATHMQMMDHLESLKTDPATLARLRAAATAQPAHARVPPGWVLVPMEPTPEMVAAGASDGRNVNGRPLWKLTLDTQARERYRAMLAAAPDAQKGAA